MGYEVYKCKNFLQKVGDPLSLGHLKIKSKVILNWDNIFGENNGLSTGVTLPPRSLYFNVWPLANQLPTLHLLSDTLQKIPYLQVDNFASNLCSCSLFPITRQNKILQGALTL